MTPEIDDYLRTANRCLGDLCSELGVTRQTLYRHVAPNGRLRKDGSRVVEGGKNRKPQGKKP
jgi:hypothetical protein